MAPAVTAMLDRAFDFSRPYIAGRVWKLARTTRGFKPSRKPVLRLKAVPTAAESLTTAGDPHTVYKSKTIIHIFATSIVHNKLGVISRC